MPKPLPTDDFRAVRIILESDDFALAPEFDPPPTDLVDQETWNGILTLPDDVSIRTSNEYGRFLRIMHGCWEAWIDSLAFRRDPIEGAVLDASDEFQAAIFNALHGYYRQAFGCLRNALEVMTIATYCQVLSRRDLFREREAGKVSISFREACDGLQGAPRLERLRATLRRELNDSIFDQRVGDSAGGWARRLYSDLSEYEHSRPKFRNVDMWQSNGPVFGPKAFTEAAARFAETSALCFLLVKMARPKFMLPTRAKELWASDTISPSQIALVAYGELFRQRKAKPMPERS